MKKLVEWEHIIHIQDELWKLRLLANSNLKIYERISELLHYVEDNIVQEDREQLNELKREVYLKIKNADSEEEKDHWYNVYQQIRFTPSDKGI